jgi:hypothetical protein
VLLALPEAPAGSSTVADIDFVHVDVKKINTDVAVGQQWIKKQP